MIFFYFWVDAFLFTVGAIVCNMISTCFSPMFSTFFIAREIKAIWPHINLDAFRRLLLVADLNFVTFTIHEIQSSYFGKRLTLLK